MTSIIPPLDPSGTHPPGHPIDFPRGGLWKVGGILLFAAFWVWNSTSPAYGQGQSPDPSTGSGSTTGTAVVSYEVALSGRRPEEARAIALRRARAEAVRRVAGTEVQAERSSVSLETQGRTTRQFTQIVRTGTAGHVVEERVLEAKVLSRNGAPFYYVRLQATVQPTAGRPDPSFTASIRLTDPDNRFVACKTKTDSDEIIAVMKVSKEAHATLFAISGDTAEVIWPNALVEESRLAPRVPTEFPSPAWRARGLRLRADLPSGENQRTEHLFLVATREPIPFRKDDAFEVQGGVLETQKASLKELNQWLVGIPLGQRATATITYVVQSASLSH